MRILVASMLSSFSIVPLYLSLLALSGGLDGRLILPILVIALLVSVAANICVALPLHFILTRLGRTHSYYYVIVGFLLPALFTIARNPFDSDVGSWVKWQALAMGVMGAIVAFIFWKIATGGRNYKKVS